MSSKKAKKGLPTETDEELNIVLKALKSKLAS